MTDGNRESETVEAFLKAISPAFDAVGKFTSAEGESVGPAGPKLSRSMKRLGTSMRQAVREDTPTPAKSAPEPVVTTSKIKPASQPLIHPEFWASISALGAYAATAPRSLAIHARHIRFQSAMAIAEIRQKIQDLRATARANKLAKFTDGAVVSAEGRPNSRIPGRIAATVMMAGVLTVTSLTFAARPHAEGIENGNFYEFPISMQHVDGQRAFPVDGAYSRPSEAFLEMADAALSLSIGKDRARVHIENSMAMFDACISRDDPCQVDTAGLLLDAKNGRFLLRAPIEAGSTYLGMALAYEEDGEIFIYGGQGGAYMREAAIAARIELPVPAQNVSTNDADTSPWDGLFPR